MPDPAAEMNAVGEGITPAAIRCWASGRFPRAIAPLSVAVSGLAPFDNRYSTTGAPERSETALRTGDRPSAALATVKK